MLQDHWINVVKKYLRTSETETVRNNFQIKFPDEYLFFSMVNVVTGWCFAFIKKNIKKCNNYQCNEIIFA